MFTDYEDIFVHYSAINGNARDHKSLIEGENVGLDLVKTDNGYIAKNVTSKKEG